MKVATALVLLATKISISAASLASTHGQYKVASKKSAYVMQMNEKYAAKGRARAAARHQQVLVGGEMHAIEVSANGDVTHLDSMKGLPIAERLKYAEQIKRERQAQIAAEKEIARRKEEMEEKAKEPKDHDQKEDEDHHEEDAYVYPSLPSIEDELAAAEEQARIKHARENDETKERGDKLVAKREAARERARRAPMYPPKSRTPSAKPRNHVSSSASMKFRQLYEKTQQRKFRQYNVFPRPLPKTTHMSLTQMEQKRGTTTGKEAQAQLQSLQAEIWSNFENFLLFHEEAVLSEARGNKKWTTAQTAAWERAVAADETIRRKALAFQQKFPGASVSMMIGDRPVTAKKWSMLEAVPNPTEPARVALCQLSHGPAMMFTFGKCAKDVGFGDVFTFLACNWAWMAPYNQLCYPNALRGAGVPQGRASPAKKEAPAEKAAPATGPLAKVGALVKGVVARKGKAEPTAQAELQALQTDIWKNFDHFLALQHEAAKNPTNELTPEQMTIYDRSLVADEGLRTRALALMHKYPNTDVSMIVGHKPHESSKKWSLMQTTPANPARVALCQMMHGPALMFSFSKCAQDLGRKDIFALLACNWAWMVPYNQLCFPETLKGAGVPAGPAPKKAAKEEAAPGAAEAAPAKKGPAGAIQGIARAAGAAINKMKGKN